MGPLEGLKVGLIGLGPLNWVGQKVRILFWGASPSFWVLNQFSQVIRGVISENISYILLVQGKELIRWIDVKHGKTSIEVLSSVILSFGCYLNILEGWIVKTSYLVIVVFLSSCVARILNLNRFKYQASLESFVTYLTLSLITQFNGHSFWRKQAHKAR